MKAFMDKEFLLSNRTASDLYHDYAENLPIVDYHCHISPKDIFEDKRFENIAQLWLGVGGENFGDHYKWRLMRSFGVEEQYISGTAPDELRFEKWAECLGKAIGNPLYHWSHLELRKYFSYDGLLNKNTWRQVWELCNEKLKQPEMSVRGIISQSKVKLICTTDDPADSLEWHIKLAADKSFDCKVIPAMRPDKVKSIGDREYLQYIEKLSEISGIRINSFSRLKEAMRNRMDFFQSLGCCLSDHAFEFVPYIPVDEAEIERIFSNRLLGILPTEEERLKFETVFLQFLAGEYSRRSWVMQLHYGCKRNNNGRRFREMGPDTGYDCIGDQAPTVQLVNFLDSMEEEGTLPKTIIYSLNPNDNAAIDSIIGCFQDSSAVSKLQHGSAWWFNDHLAGMREQLISLANLGNLSGFVGMLTDSRSFLSYTRHDYFRRILCQLLGEWVEQGLFPDDREILGEIVKDISYNNAVRFFGFDLPEFR